jgi:hypothetical protein
MSDARRDIVIHIDGKAFQPLKKILAKDQLLELAGLDPKQHQIFLIDNKSREHRIDSEEGLELQDGMEFRVRQNT